MNDFTSEPTSALRRSPFFWLAVAAFVFGALSAVRLPGIWSATHLLFDYSAGFVKRGLAGEVLSVLLGHSVSYGVLATISYAICAVWLVMFFLRLRAIGGTDLRIWLFAAVFMVSPGFVFLLHEIGYFDHIGLIVVFLCFLMPATLAGFLGRMALCVAMIFVHEAFFLFFLPAVGIEFWLRAALAGQDRALAGVVLLVAATAGATFALGQSTLPVERQAAYIEHVESRAADFTIRPTAVKVLFRDGRKNLYMMLKWWNEPKRWVEALMAAIFLLPLPAGLILVSWSVVQRAPLPRRTQLLMALGIPVAALSPLLLNAFAWDLWRFFALAQVSAFLVFMAVGGSARVALVPARFAGPAAYGLVVLAVLGAATAIPLFDYYEAVKPPYLPHLNHVFDALRGEVPWFSIPEL